MTEPRMRLLAAAATVVGLAASGLDAHLAPQGDGWWHGVTGSPSFLLIALALGAGAVVWRLGEVANVGSFLWMGVGLLPFLPALTGFGAPLLIFSGYTMGLLLAILLGFSSRDLVPKLAAPRTGLSILISFAFFLLVGRYLPGAAGPQGDEPHYLLIAVSLLEDGDVDLENQFDNRAFSTFTSANLEPHTAPRSPRGKLYAIHTPGLSALIAPGYALLGFAGARAIVSAVMAIVVGLLVHATRSWFGERTANFVFLLSTFASPLPVYANALFPDSVATLPVAATLAYLVSSHSALLALASVAIAGLPWLHPRFLPLALLLALAVALRGGFSPRRAAVAFVPVLASLGLLLLHFQDLFGRASLSAAYGPGFSSDVSISRIPYGALALTLDRQFGLLLFAPVLLLGLRSVSWSWKRDGMVTGVSAGVVVLLLSVGGSFSMWWGGASAPARFLIGAVPALLLFCAAEWDRSTGAPGRRRLLAAAAGFGLGLLSLACLAPRALHNRSDGESGLLRLLAPMLDLDRFFPSFVPGGEGKMASPKPLLDPFSSTLRAAESWNDHRRTLGGRDSEATFVLDVPLGPSSWDLAPGVQLYSSRFSLPKGSWTLKVQSRSIAEPGVLNVARVALLAGAGETPPLGVTLLKVGVSEAVADFELGRSERRVLVRADGLQSRSTILSIKLVPKTLTQ